MIRCIRMLWARIVHDDRPRCLECGRVLNATELYYYGITCEKCEERITRLIEKGDEEKWLNSMMKYLT